MNKRLEDMLKAGVVMMVLAGSGKEAEGAYIVTRPEKEQFVSIAKSKNLWNPDGRTVYKLHVYADNRGLEGEATNAIQWRLGESLIFDYGEGSNSLPNADDFFRNSIGSFVLNNVSPPGELSQRFLFGDGPTNRDGVVGEYEYIVPLGTPGGAYPISLFDTEFVGPNSDIQPHSVFSVPIVVAPEPSSLGLFGLGLGGIFGSSYFGRRR